MKKPVLTLRGKVFQVKPLRPQVVAAIKFLNKTKLGQLFTPQEIAKAAKSSSATVIGWGPRRVPELVKYSTSWRGQKMFGKPATIKLLQDEIKATRF